MKNTNDEPTIRKLEVHEDSRGWFAEILRPKNISKKSFGQISVTAIAPNKSKGNHYHRRQREWFIAVSGSVRLTVFSVKTGKKIIYELDSKELNIVHIPPYWQHILDNNSHQIAIVLLYSDTQNNMQNLDVFTEKL